METMEAVMVAAVMVEAAVVVAQRVVAAVEVWLGCLPAPILHSTL